MPVGSIHGRKCYRRKVIRTVAFILACLTGFGVVAARDLESALDQARQLGQEHRYSDVIELLTHFQDLEDPEAQYVLAAEIGRAHYHLGDYQTANSYFRRAVILRPQRVETALYLQATSYLTGDREQAYVIFREIVAGGATDLYLAVTLPGERIFLADPVVWKILDELATPVEVDVDRGSVFDIELGQTRADVERRLGAEIASTGDALTARAGPNLTLAYGFDASGTLSQIMLHNQHLLRYTPYRLHIGPDLDSRATPAMATAALGAPKSTSTSGDEIVIMVWLRQRLRLTLEFAPPPAPAPPGLAADKPILRVVKMEAFEPPAEDPQP